MERPAVCVTTAFKTAEIGTHAVGAVRRNLLWQTEKLQKKTGRFCARFFCIAKLTLTNIGELL